MEEEAIVAEVLAHREAGAKIAVAEKITGA